MNLPTSSRVMIDLSFPFTRSYLSNYFNPESNDASLTERILAQLTSDGASEGSVTLTISA